MSLVEVIRVIREIEKLVPEVIPKPKGKVHRVGSIKTSDGYETLVSYTPNAGKKFQLTKILVSGTEDFYYKLSWGGTDISPEVIVPGKTPWTDWFPWDYEEMVGDGSKTFEIKVKYVTTSGVCWGEIVGEEV